MNINLSLAVLLSVNLVCASNVNAEDEIPSVPSTDIIVISVDSADRLTKIDAGNALNVFQYDGYDNQPHFSADGKQLYFTRMLDKQTDIFVYHFDTEELINITNTDDISEYSPTVYNESSLSVIGVNPEGQQHLRLIDLTDVSQQVLNPAIEPVGYHAWLNSDFAAVFVLGEVMTLQLLDVQAEGEASPLVKNIGRCLQRIETNKVSFTRLIDDLHHIFTVNNEGLISPTKIILPANVQDYVWWDSEGVLVGHDSYIWYISSTEKKKIFDLSALEINNISRLAIDSKKQKLAIVYE